MAKHNMDYDSYVNIRVGLLETFNQLENLHEDIGVRLPEAKQARKLLKAIDKAVWQIFNGDYKARVK